MTVLTSHPTDSPQTWACEGNLRMSSGLTFICRHCSSRPWVFHIQVKAGFLSQDAQLPHGRLFIARWRRCLTSAPGRTRCPTTVDAVAMETGLCWHHRIWGYLPWRPTPRFAHDPDLSEACETLSTSSWECVNQKCSHTDRDMFGGNIMMFMCKCVCFRLCFIAASLETHTGQSWSELYSLVNIFTGALKCCVNRYER